MDRLMVRDRFFFNNPVFMQGLGLAPIVVAATNLHNALILGFAVLLLLTPTGSSPRSLLGAIRSGSGASPMP